ncbi:MAG: sterol desaturase family protein [Acidimicrobiales bacterium]
MSNLPIELRNTSPWPWRANATVLAALALVAYMLATGQPGNLGATVQHELRGPLLFLVSAQSLVIIPLIFLAERVIPADPTQRSFSPSVIVDGFMMMVMFPATHGLAIVATQPLGRWLDAHAGFLVLDATRSWPLWPSVILGVLIGDLGAYVVHLIKHQVPLFWRFHAVHHSQVHLTYFTTNKIHPFDYLIEHAVLFVPFFFLLPEVTEQPRAVTVLGLALLWFRAPQHANVRVNLGPLRWFMVSPQNHRIHHSADPAHYNSNYSSLFTWDRLFGTQHPDDVSYPATGIGDPEYPEPRSYRPRDLLSSVTAQLLYPFSTRRS